MNRRGREPSPKEYLEKILEDISGTGGIYILSATGIREEVTKDYYFYDHSIKRGRRLVKSPGGLSSIAKIPINVKGMQINEETSVELKTKDKEEIIDEWQKQGLILYGSLFKYRASANFRKRDFDYEISFDTLYGQSPEVARQVEVEVIGNQNYNLLNMRGLIRTFSGIEHLLIRDFPRVEIVSLTPTDEPKWKISQRLK